MGLDLTNRKQPEIKDFSTNPTRSGPTFKIITAIDSPQIKYSPESAFQLPDKTQEIIEKTKALLSEYIGTCRCSWPNLHHEIDMWFKVSTVNSQDGHRSNAARLLGIARTSLMQSLNNKGQMAFVKSSCAANVKKP